MLESLCNKGLVSIEGSYNRLPQSILNDRGFYDYTFYFNNIISINNGIQYDLESDELISKALRWFSNDEVKVASNLIILEEEKTEFIKILRDKSAKLGEINKDIKEGAEQWSKCD